MVKKLWNGFTTLIVIIVVVLAVLLVGVRIAGFQVFTVLSGSMEPTLHVGSLVYVRRADSQDLKPGDVITYMVSDTTVVTHRITGVVPDDTEPDTHWFRTKGDANDTEDTALVHYRNILGRAVFSIPYLGYLSHYIQNPPGLYVALGCGGVLLIIVFLPRPKKKEQSPEKTG